MTYTARSRLRTYPGKNTDPTRWDRFVPPAGDAVICGPAKSGTTWIQGIAAMLIAGNPGVDAQVSSRAPRLDIQPPEWAETEAILKAQTHSARSRPTRHLTAPRSDRRCELLDPEVRHWLENGFVPSF